MNITNLLGSGPPVFLHWLLTSPAELLRFARAAFEAGEVRPNREAMASGGKQFPSETD
jgi:hypothetical protein